MQAIQTKFISATNHKGARIKASCERGSLTVDWNYDLDTEANHILACSVLRTRFICEDSRRYASVPEVNPWSKPMVCGPLLDGTYAHVFTV